jgi:hypothetical protein
MPINYVSKAGQAHPEVAKPMPNSLALLKGVKTSAEILQVSPKALSPALSDSSSFEYGSLPADLAATAKASAHAVLEGMQNLKDSYIIIGTHLREMKDKLPHGRFGAWLEFELGMKDKTAQNYMNAADHLGQNPNDVSLPPSVIYALASPSTPEEVKQQVKKQLAAGMIPKASEVKAAIKASKAEKPTKSTTDPLHNEPTSASKLGLATSEAAPDDKAEEAKAKIVKRLRAGMKPDDRLNLSGWCLTAGWTELGERLSDGLLG